MKQPRAFEDPFVQKPDACVFFGDVSDKTIDNWVETGILPPPIRITERTVGWRLSTLKAVISCAEKKEGKVR